MGDRCASSLHPTACACQWRSNAKPPGWDTIGEPMPGYRVDPRDARIAELEAALAELYEATKGRADICEARAKAERALGRRK